jgi:hypothetical protein
MGCRCNERRAAIGRAIGSAIRGDVASVRREVDFVGRSAAEDARAALTRRQMVSRLAGLRIARR